MATPSPNPVCHFCRAEIPDPAEARRIANPCRSCEPRFACVTCLEEKERAEAERRAAAVERAKVILGLSDDEWNARATDATATSETTERELVDVAHAEALRMDVQLEEAKRAAA